MDEAKFTTPTVSADQLGKLLLMQSMLESLPDEAAIRSFIARGLSDLPGVAAARICEASGEMTEPDNYCFRLNLGNECKGELRLTCNDPAAFKPYEVYLRNFCFMVAVILEERQQRHRRESQQATLEKLVQERTRELQRQIADRSRAEAALLDSRRLLAQAEKMGRVGGWEFDIATKEQTWTETVFDIHQVAQVAHAGQPSVEEGLKFYTPASRPIIEAAVRRAIEQGEPFDLELEINTAQGQLRSVHVIGQTDLAHGKVFGFFQDITERKQAEAALAHERNLLRTLIDHIPDSIYVQDAAGRFLLANETLARRFGVARPADLLGKTDADFYPAEAAANFAALDREVFAGRTLLNHEQALCLPNGERKVILSTKVPLKNTQGTVTAIVGIGRDITERKQVEAELRLSHDRHRRAIIAASAIPYQKDYAADVYVFMGEGIQAITGYTPAELRSSVWREIILETIFLGDAAGLTGAQAVQRMLAGELKSWQTDHRIRTRSGDIRWISDSSIALLDAGGKYAGSIGIIQDITERKRAEAQMNLQSSALTVAANAIAITDRQGRIEWVNPSFTRLTGYSAAECLGRNPRLLKSGQQSPAFYADLWATILAGNVWHGELINQRKDGRLYTEDMTITPVRGANGQITHFVAIKQDVTERHQLENQLRQAQKMEAIGTLAGGIAHDFNNILAAIYGYSYLLQSETENNPGAQEAIEEILKAANRAKDLVQQILTFSRQREQKREVIRLGPVVKEATKFLRASLPAEIQIELKLAADAPAVLADPTQIYQVTMNLATNALHAMENRPGCLTVSLEARVPDAALICAHPELLPKEYVRLSVADTGQGMDAPTLARIFDPFFTTKPVGKGTGLGLAVVHGIVQSHEGVITVESQPGRGTTFSLYFPAQMSGPELDDRAAKNISHGHGQKILLVDDEPALTTIFQRLLVRLAYQVTVCNNARESLDLCRQNPAAFDLVITDLTMPELNGLEVARHIHAFSPRLPIILITGHAPNLTPENLRAAGICGVIEKPVTLAALAEVVQRTLQTA